MRRASTFSPWIVVPATTIPLVILWHVAELPGLPLSLVVGLIGVASSVRSSEALLAWLISVLQFHPAAFAPLLNIGQVSLAPVDLGIVLMAARIGVLIRSRPTAGTAVGHTITSPPLVVLCLFAFAGAVSLGLAIPSFGSAAVAAMTVSFVKMLEGGIVLLLVTCLVCTAPQAGGDRLLFTLTWLIVLQASYAVIGGVLQTFLFIDISPVRLRLPGDSGDLPVFDGYGPFEYLIGARSSSIIGGPAQIGVVAGIGTLFAFWRAQAAIRTQERTVWSAATVVCLLAVIVSLSRTAWLSMAVVSIFAMAALHRERWMYLRLLGIALICALPLSPVLLGRVSDLQRPSTALPVPKGTATAPPVAEPTQIVIAADGTIRVERQSAEEFADRSTLNLRLATWRFGLYYLARSPVFGLGWSAPRFLVVMDDHVLRELLPTFPAQAFIRTAGTMHNTYLELAVGNGAIGLGLFLLFVLMMANRARRIHVSGRAAKSLAGFAILGAYLYFLTDGLGDSWLLAGSPTAWYFWILGSIALAWTRSGTGLRGDEARVV